MALTDTLALADDLAAALAESRARTLAVVGYEVLRGGSWATHPRAASRTFRNWDLPIRRQIFAGFRCARDDA